MTITHHVALRVDAAPTPFVRRRPRPIRIALAGYGIVGQALAERLEGDADYALVGILVRDPHRARRVSPPAPLLTDRRALLDAKPDVLIDALSCSETGALLSQSALARGIHLVSASKRVIAGCHASLAERAAVSGARFLYSAAVGGETPILETVRETAAESGVQSVAAILNGTVNFILDGLARGLGFEAALRAAQAAGFAEEEPSEDLSGADALAKLRIVAATAFGGDPGDYDFPVDPLDPAAASRIAASARRWVQLARVELQEGRILGSVRLCPRSAAGALPLVEREWNCALVTSRDGFSRTCLGRGAGGTATAGALIADLARVTQEAL